MDVVSVVITALSDGINSCARERCPDRLGRSAHQWCWHSKVLMATDPNRFEVRQKRPSGIPISPVEFHAHARAAYTSIVIMLRPGNCRSEGMAPAGSERLTSISPGAGAWRGRRTRPTCATGVHGHAETAAIRTVEASGTEARLHSYNRPETCFPLVAHPGAAASTFPFIATRRSIPRSTTPRPLPACRRRRIPTLTREGC